MPTPGIIPEHAQTIMAGAAMERKEDAFIFGTLCRMSSIAISKFHYASIDRDCLRCPVIWCQITVMDLSNFENMDPHLLVGLVNTELRNNCESLDDLVKTHCLAEDLLLAKLAGAGYGYREEQRQFR